MSASAALPYETIKASVFDEPQFLSFTWRGIYQEDEKGAWRSFMAIITVRKILLDNKNDEVFGWKYFVDFSQSWMQHDINVKIHSLHSHIYHFQENFGVERSKQGERIHQDNEGALSRSMVQEYNGKILLEYQTTLSWGHKRMSYKRKIFIE